MVKALCINSEDLILPKNGTLLTEGKFYIIVQNINNDVLSMIDDSGKINFYHISRFKLIDELRQEKLDQLGI